MTSKQTTYPLVKAGVELHLHASGGFVMLPARTEGLRLPLKPGLEYDSHEQYAVDGYALDFLALADGVHGYEEILSAFVLKYGPVFAPLLLERAWRFSLTTPAVCEHLEVPASTPNRTRITGTDDAYWPLHVSFEIIETCNMYCDHCYYKASPDKTGRVSLDDALEIMRTLRRNGVRVIELTGGECTIHPDFCEILDEACKLFDLVAVISNGYRIGTHAKIANAIIRQPNVAVQISIDAVGERHNEFRKHNKAFRGAVRAVSTLVAAGIPTRIGTSISEENVDQIVPLYLLGLELGVPKHSFAPVAAHGRGCNITDAQSGAAYLMREINEQLSAFSGDMRLRDTPIQPEIGGVPTESAPHNCGAGWRSFTVDFYGEVRACNYSLDSKNFGNVVHDDFRSTFGQRANYFFANAPSPGGLDCEGCAYFVNCRGCFVKAFMVSETEYPECPWRQRWFPGMPLSKVGDRDESLTRHEKLALVPPRSPLDHPTVHSKCGGPSEPTLGSPPARKRHLPILT